MVGWLVESWSSVEAVGWNKVCHDDDDDDDEDDDDQDDMSSPWLYVD